jgi:hypothetical protein
MLFFVWLLSIGFAVSLAAAKHRSIGNWIACTVLFGPLGLLLLMAMPTRTRRQQAPMQTGRLYWDR